MSKVESAAGLDSTRSGPVWGFSRSAIAATVGTTVEWYDFQIYGLAAALVFSKQFFPNFDPLAGTLLSFATFGVGFLARPIGGIIFGHMGDRIGRKSTLVATFMLTGIATFLVGLLPNYESAGAVAPALLVLLRLLQGVGLGGEWGGAVLVMTEGGSQKRRGFLGGWPQLGSPAGLVLATLIFSATTALLSSEEFASWGWRLPFLLSFILVVVGFVARISMPETPVFRQAQRSNAIARSPLLETLKTQWQEVLLAAGLFLVTSGGFYVYVTFMVTYGSSNAFAFPLFWLVNTRVPGLILLGMGIGGIANGILFGIMGSLGPELFKTQVRYTGASLGYQLSAALGGGLTPLIATALVSWAGGSYWPAPAWLAGLALISLVAALIAPETRTRSLTADVVA